MAIENNLPVIFDTATQTEDGLMSYKDKIKLDNMEEELNNRVTKDDKITSAQLDTSSDEVKIQPENLSDAVKAMMTGETAVEATVPNDGVTTEKIANNAVTIDKIDKRVLLGNIVSPGTLNFTFDTKKVTINVPMGTLLLIDAFNKRYLTSKCETEHDVVNINYPSEFDGLNYIISTSNGSLSMVNYRKANTISNTSSIIALVSLTPEFEATLVMNGSYNINGLAQGIGTESATLMGTGKIVFDALDGIIDFTEATELHLITGGVYNRMIKDQSSIRLADYSPEVIYILYWDNASSSLKTGLATLDNVDTDINKLALIKDGRITPFINTGIFYSKPYLEAPYYTESFEYINNILVSSKSKINILKETTCKIEFADETFVCLNEETMEVENTEALYEDREGLHYILFDLDAKQISCKYHSEAIIDAKNIVIGTMYVTNETILVSGSFEYTIDGKAPYEHDIQEIKNSVNNVSEIIAPDMVDNKLLAVDEIYTITEDELPIYSSSAVVSESEGLKLAVSYNKNNDVMKPRVKFFDGNIEVDSTMGDNISLLAVDKYNSRSYFKKDIKVNSIYKDAKEGRTLKVLCLGDDLINDETAFFVRHQLEGYGITTNMIGTMLNSNVNGEGRKGWFYSTFVGASGRGLEEGKITPQTSQGSSSILLNPFIRIADADDKANHPNDCYRATGAYLEKNYQNDSDKNGAFYIFDFDKYLETQGIETPDVVVIALKPELSYAYTEDVVSTNMRYLNQIVTGIRKALPDTVIAIIPQYGSNNTTVWEDTCDMIDETVSYVKGLEDDKIKVLPAWLHMNREFGTEYDKIESFDHLYSDITNTNPLDNKLSKLAKIELANSITAFILNI